MISVIYHKNCNDGIMSAYLMYRLYQEFDTSCSEIEFIPDDYSNKIFPKVNGDKLFILDYSYGLTTLREIASSGDFTNIIMLDHHESTADEYGGYKRYNSIVNSCICSINLEKDKSGAGLTYEYICENYPDSQVANDKDLARYVSLVQDRDLWKFEYVETKAFHSLLSKYRNSLQEVDNLLSSPAYEINALISQEQIVLNYKQSLFKDLASKAVDIEFQGYIVPIVNCPSQFASDVGEILYQNKPFSICYVTSKDKVILSLRSDKTKGVNVKEIAEKFGGGGHIPAAGCSLPLEKLFDLMNGKL